MSTRRGDERTLDQRHGPASRGPAGWASGSLRETEWAVLEIGSRMRKQPAPPHILFEALTQPDRDSARLWLVLLDDEQRPTILHTAEPAVVIWSSLWRRRPDATIRFTLSPEPGGEGTELRWTLLVEPPEPDQSAVGHFRKRLNQLVNADLRLSLGQ